MYQTDTFSGNLAQRPILRQTTSGTPVANLRVASHPRYFDKSAGTWKSQDETQFHDVVVYGRAATTAAQLDSGAPILVLGGRVELDQYTNREGDLKARLVVTADQVVPNLAVGDFTIAHHPRVPAKASANLPSAPAAGGVAVTKESWSR